MGTLRRNTKKHNYPKFVTINSNGLKEPLVKSVLKWLFVMGCGASKVAPQTDEEAKHFNVNGKKVEHDSRSNGHANGSITAAKSKGSVELNSTPNSAVINGNLNVKPKQNNEDVNSISNREVLDKQGSKETQHSPTHGKWIRAFS